MTRSGNAGRRDGRIEAQIDVTDGKATDRLAEHTGLGVEDQLEVEIFALAGWDRLTRIGNG